MGIFDFLKRKNTSSDERRLSLQVEVTSRFIDNSTCKIPTLESRMKKCYTSKNGLYPHEILMISYSSGYKTTNNKFPRFWEYSYSVTEPQKILDSLLKRGFIRIGSVHKVLEKTKVADLKSLIIRKGGKPTGKKCDLISQVKKLYSDDELNAGFPNRYYEPTELGEAELQENEYVTYFHYNDYFSSWDMNVLLHKYSSTNMNFKEIYWKELNRLPQNRNIKYAMYQFMSDEEKYNDSLHYLIEVVSYDLSISRIVPLNTNNAKRTNFDDTMSNLSAGEYNGEVNVYQGILEDIKIIKEKLALSDSDFIKRIYNEFRIVNNKDNLFTSEERANIVLSGIGLEERNLKDSYRIAEQRVKKILNLK